MFLQPISAVHSALLAWRLRRATRSVGTWAWPECSRAIWGHGAVGGGRPKLLSAWDTWCSGTWGVGWVGSSAGLSGAGRCPKQGVRKEVARQSQAGCSMHLPGCPHSSAFRTYELAHDWWWCVHICVGVCGVLRTFYGSRLTATSIKRVCGSENLDLR